MGGRHKGVLLVAVDHQQQILVVCVEGARHDVDALGHGEVRQLVGEGGPLDLLEGFAGEACAVAARAVTELAACEERFVDGDYVVRHAGFAGEYYGIISVFFLVQWLISRL